MLPRKLLRTAWLSATSVLAAAVLTVATTPASADDVGILELEEVSGTGHGLERPSFSGVGTPLLDQFEYRYSNSDHHLRHLTSMPNGNVLDVNFSDNNGDDEYTYRIAYQRVPASGISVGNAHIECGGGACTTNVTNPGGNVVFVITGFRFAFDSDHHIDSIGIRESGGVLTTWFDDQNDDDDYSVDVSFAWVPRTRFSVVSQAANGNVPPSAAGVHTTTGLPAGTKVIRGFRVDNLSSGGGGDNHIKTFGVRTSNTSITVLYGDKNAADSAAWSYFVQYANLV